MVRNLFAPKIRLGAQLGVSRRYAKVSQILALACVYSIVGSTRKSAARSKIGFLLLTSDVDNRRSWEARKPAPVNDSSILRSLERRGLRSLSEDEHVPSDRAPACGLRRSVGAPLHVSLSPKFSDAKWWSAQINAGV